MWLSVASSSDGTKLVAVNQGSSPAYAGRIYTSTNSGATWTLTSAPANRWNAVASSADGTRLVATANGGPVYVSIDSGITWTLSDDAFQFWTSVASSADGTKLLGVTSPGVIYTLQSAGVALSPVLNISLSGNQAFLTWLTNNATGFNLQQNTNLLTTNWVAVSGTPAVASISYQLTVLPTNRQNFYRLKSP
jgi:hypothetical protein